MQKELHIWLNSDYAFDMTVEVNTYTTLTDTFHALRRQEEIIHTTQPHVCSTVWLVKGYRIFVHMLDGEKVELKLGDMGKNMREIRIAHNLEKMLLANCFGHATEDFE